jgi:hypothetical protein
MKNMLGKCAAYILEVLKKDDIYIENGFGFNSGADKESFIVSSIKEETVKDILLKMDIVLESMDID